jgi:Tat protein secretion system quality control protein TatD with DNase activity
LSLANNTLLFMLRLEFTLITLENFQLTNDQSSNNNQRLNDQIEKQIQELRELVREPKVVAIGEVGLDKHEYMATRYKPQATSEERTITFEVQKQLFTEQVRLAGEVDKPLIIHSREVGDEVLEIIEKFTIKRKTSPNLVRGRSVFIVLRGRRSMCGGFWRRGFMCRLPGM